jgi:hypothetical protein
MPSPHDIKAFLLGRSLSLLEALRKVGCKDETQSVIAHAFLDLLVESTQPVPSSADNQSFLGEKDVANSFPQSFAKATPSIGFSALQIERALAYSLLSFSNRNIN